MNDEIRKDEAGPATALDEVVQRTAQQVSERHELHDTAAGQGGSDSTAHQANLVGESVSQDGRKIFSRSVQAVVRCFDLAMRRRLGRAAFTLSNDREFAQSIVADAAITTEELDQIGELSAIVAEKYALLTSFAPEIGLVCVVVGYGARVTHATRKLEELANRKEPHAKQDH